MTIAFSMTGRELVTKAMQDRQVLALGETPAGEELQYGLDTLNLFLKSLCARGASPWSEVEGVATAVAGSADIALSPRPLGVEEARLSLSASYQRPMTFMERGEYLTLPNKAQPGEPLIYSLKFTVSDVEMTVWPVPTVNRQILYTYSRVIEDATADNPVDLPQMWTEAVQKILTVKMTAFADPPNIQQLMADAAALEAQLLDFDRPASYTIGRDC